MILRCRKLDTFSRIPQLKSVVEYMAKFKGGIKILVTVVFGSIMDSFK